MAKTPEPQLTYARESARRARIRQGFKILQRESPQLQPRRPWQQRIAGADEEWLVALVKDNPELSLLEIQRLLADRGVICGYSTLWSTLRRNGVLKRKLALQRRLEETGPT